MSLPLSQLLDVAAISPDPDQPRKDFNSAEMARLQANIELKGLLQPIIVRPAKAAGQVLEGRWIIVAGERRFRCVVKLGWTQIAAIVRDEADAEVIDTQLAENDIRSALKALERADAHQRMRARGLTNAEIAKRTSDSEATVRDSLKLQELIPEVKKAWTQGKLDYSKALNIAKVPGQMQGAVLAAYFKESEEQDPPEPLTVLQLQRLIRVRFMLDLKKAPFAIADAQLIPSAGSCTNCPKRTGAQPELFAHLKQEPDLCLDKPCHAAKVDAHLAQLEKAGREVLSPKETARLFPHGTDHFHDDEFALAGGKNWDSKKTFGELVGAEKIVFGKAPDGEMVALIRKADLPKEKPQPAEVRKKSPAETKRERDHAVRKEAASNARLELHQKVEKASSDTMWLRAAFVAMLSCARSDPLKKMARWYDVDGDDAGSPAAELASIASKLKDGPLRAMVFDLALAERYEPWFNNDSHTDVLENACGLLGVDLKKIEKGIRERMDEDAKEKKKPGLPLDLFVWKKKGTKWIGKGSGDRAYEVEKRGGLVWVTYTQVNGVSGVGTVADTIEKGKLFCEELQLKWRAKELRPNAYDEHGNPKKKRRLFVKDV